jgi:hypothetical protein
MTPEQRASNVERNRQWRVEQKAKALTSPECLLTLAELVTATAEAMADAGWTIYDPALWRQFAKEVELISGEM